MNLSNVTYRDNGTALADRNSEIDIGVSVVGTLIGGALLCVGIFGNLLTILSILVIRSLRKAENAIICSLVFCDFLILTTNYSLHFTVFINRRWTLDGPACVYTTKELNVLITSSSLHVFVSALHRYLKIVHPNKAPILTRKKIVTFCLILLYLVPLVIIMINDTSLTMPRFGIDVVYDTKIMFCESLIAGPKSKMRAFSATFSFILLLSIALGFFYVRIIMISKKAQNAVSQLSATNGPVARSQNNIVNERKRDFRLMKTMILIMVLYSISYLTLPLMGIIDKQRKLSKWLYLSSVLVFWMSSSINWIFYGLLNRRFKRGHSLLFNKFRRRVTSSVNRKDRIAPSTSTNERNEEVGGANKAQTEKLENTPVPDNILSLTEAASTHTEVLLLNAMGVKHKQFQKVHHGNYKPRPRTCSPVTQSSHFMDQSSSHPLQSSSHPLQSSSHPLQSSSHPLQSSSHPLQSSSHPLQSSSSLPCDHSDSLFETDKTNLMICQGIITLHH